MASRSHIYGVLLLSQLAGVLSLPSSHESHNGLVQLPVVRRFTSHVTHKRDSTALSGSILNEKWYYGVEVLMGTPSQKTYVEVDTGSDQLWVNANCSAAPTELNEQELCESIPKYDPKSSSSAKGPSGSGRIQYGTSLGGDLTGVEMDYYNDTISINGATIDSQQFGVATASRGLPFGILGMAPPQSGFEINESYPRVLDSLSLNGAISSRAYSLHLGSSEDSTGSLILGGLDKGKFIGTLQQVPIVTSTDNVTRLTVNYNSLSITSNSNATKQYTLNNTNVQLDSGTTFLTLEETLVDQIYADLGVTLDSSTGYPLIDCSARSWSGGMSFGFGDKVVTATFRDLIFSADGLCALGLQSIASGGQQILGVPFFRAAYVAFDFDNKHAHIAQAGNCTEDLVAIGSGSSAVPNVTGSCFSTPTPAPLTNGAARSFSGIGVTTSLSIASIVAATLAMGML